MATVVHVVDDNASFRTAIGRLLRASGYEVIEYASASQVLERIPEDAGPGCILLDVQMPGMSGPELQDRLSRSGSTLPIVFLTGSEEGLPPARGLKEDGDVLLKPVPRETLLRAIEGAIARHRARRKA